MTDALLVKQGGGRNTERLKLATMKGSVNDIVLFY